MVIVVLGIVSSIGASIIAQVYENYIIQRAQYRATNKTELALKQIANRLRYAIPNTIGIRKNNTTDTFIDISTNPHEEVKVLQWVGYDGDSFEAISGSASTGAARRPGWSGFCDVNDTINTTGKLITPGSNLEFTSTIISKLGGNIDNASIYFADTNGTSYGISGGSSESITLDSPFPLGTMINERYKLAWSSYALEIDSDNDLILHYNFSPTRATVIDSSKQILLKNVANFRFRYADGAFRLKICKKEQIGMDENITIHACKEKVVF